MKRYWIGIVDGKPSVESVRAQLQKAITLAYRASKDLHRGPPRNSDYDREADITAQIDKLCRDYPMTQVDGSGDVNG